MTAGVPNEVSDATFSSLSSHFFSKPSSSKGTLPNYLICTNTLVAQQREEKEGVSASPAHYRRKWTGGGGRESDENPLVTSAWIGIATLFGLIAIQIIFGDFSYLQASRKINKSWWHLQKQRQGYIAQAQHHFQGLPMVYYVSFSQLFSMFKKQKTKSWLILWESSSIN